MRAQAHKRGYPNLDYASTFEYFNILAVLSLCGGTLYLDMLDDVPDQSLSPEALGTSLVPDMLAI